MCSYLPNPSHFETNSLQLHPYLSLVEAQPALVLEAVARSGFALEFASEQLRKDRSFVLQAAPWCRKEEQPRWGNMSIPGWT